MKFPSQKRLKRQEASPGMISFESNKRTADLPKTAVRRAHFPWLSRLSLCRRLSAAMERGFNTHGVGTPLDKLFHRKIVKKMN